jgi:hypothetical protein
VHPLPIPSTVASEKKEADEAVRATDRPQADSTPYSIFTLNEKRFMVFIVTFAALFSPVSATIYYPALGPLAAELQVSDSSINLTITTFMVNTKMLSLMINRDLKYMYLPDIPRVSPCIYRCFCRCRRTTAGIFDSFRCLYRCECWPCAAEKLCCASSLAMRPKLG